MSQSSYVGRHRPAAKPSRGRRYVVPVALLSSTIVGGLVIREAGASELSAEAAAMKDLSASVAGLGLAADPDAVTAASAGRGADTASRDSARNALAAATAVSSVADAQAEKVAAARVAQAKADRAAKAKAAQAAAAKKAQQVKAAQARAAASAHRWVAPLSNYTLTSGFGYRWGKMHPGQDLATPVGSRVHALSSGTVVFAGWDNTGYGYLVRIEYWDGTVSYMAHNSRLVVAVGQKVRPGDLVAYSGNTGNSTGPHVHLEIHPADGSVVSPLPWLARQGLSI